MKASKMCFDADEVVKVRLYRKTFTIAKREIAAYLEEKPKSELTLQEELLYFYLPLIITIDADDGGEWVTLSPIRVKIAISKELLGFLSGNYFA